MTTETMTKPSIPEVCQATRILVGRLGRLQEDETVPYSELSSLIAIDVQGPGRGYLASARRIVERDRSVALVCVFKEGIKRLPANKASLLGDVAMEGIRKKARRETKRMVGVLNSPDIDNEARIATNARLSALGAISMLSSPKNVSRLEDRVRLANAAEVPVGTVLEMFRS